MRFRRVFTCLVVAVLALALSLATGWAGAPGRASKIVFSSDAITLNEIYVMNDDGRARVRLTRREGSDYFPNWSPDGKRIAWSSGSFSLSKVNIYVMNADGTNRRRVTRYQLADQVPDWSPDGKRLAFQARDFDSDFEITVVNADGSGRRRLTRDKFDDTEPAWSPDGRTIAFSSNRDGDFEIFVMNVDGSGAKQLTHNSIDDGEPAWSPDGRTIAFTSLARQRLAVSAACELLGVAEFLGIKVRPSVFRMNADGSAPRRLAQRACGPAWTADGEELGFVSDRAGNSEIYVMGADGLSVRRVTHTPANEHSPDWQR